MKIKLFEKYIEEIINENVIYGITDFDKHGDRIGFEVSDDENDEWNPFSLVDTVKIYIKYKATHPNLQIEKMITEIVDDKTIDEIKMKLTANKYNL
jgi:hypothetical protein